jgi:dimethylaniline monooxygenase (N-oxide forming)
MRVAVIGAGVAGLVSAKVLKADGFHVTVFEKDSTVGGVWSPTRAYTELRTNNPREAYAFSDFPHPASSDEFPTAGQAHAYLESYAEHSTAGRTGCCLATSSVDCG